MIKTLHFSFLIISLLAFVSLTSCSKTEQKIEQKPVEYKIPIKVGIIYSMGGVQAVAREDFYLLNKDALQIWKEAGLLEGMKNEDEFMIRILLHDVTATKDKPSKFDETLKPYTVKTTTTDFEGNAAFENVPQGEYYIYGRTETRGGNAVWNYKVSTNPENKTAILDNKNAIYSK
jgi:predicted acylesterase/phospholipase RssA